MTDLSANLALTIYAVASDFGQNIGFGGAFMTTSFADAWSAWYDQEHDGCPSAVIEINLRDGTAKDVTAAARLAAQVWWVSRPGDGDMPEWLEAA